MVWTLRMSDRYPCKENHHFLHFELLGLVVLSNSLLLEHVFPTFLFEGSLIPIFSFILPPFVILLFFSLSFLLPIPFLFPFSFLPLRSSFTFYSFSLLVASFSLSLFCATFLSLPFFGLEDSIVVGSDPFVFSKVSTKL